MHIGTMEKGRTEECRDLKINAIAQCISVHKNLSNEMVSGLEDIAQAQQLIGKRT